MENTFKSIRTQKDIAISFSLIIGGILIFILHKGLGVILLAVGLILLLFRKSAYWDPDTQLKLKEKSYDLSMSCRNSLKGFLDGSNKKPEIIEGNDGGSIRLEVFYNQKDSVVYVQVYDFKDYVYQANGEMIKLTSDKAQTLLNLLNQK